MYNEQQGLSQVDSESATTNHEENHAGAFPVVLSLCIVVVLALLAFSLTSFIAGMLEGPLYASLRNEYSNSSSLDYDWYFDDWGYDPWDYDTWDYDTWGYYGTMSDDHVIPHHARLS